MRIWFTLIAIITIPIVYIGTRGFFGVENVSSARAMFMGLELSGIIIIQTWLPRRRKKGVASATPLFRY